MPRRTRHPHPPRKHDRLEEYGEPRAAYWAEWQAAHPVEPPKPRRTARMIPDDRADEAISFDTVFDRMIDDLVKGQQEAQGVDRLEQGRGAA